MMIQTTAPCLVCRQKNETYTEARLAHLYRFLQDSILKPEEEPGRYSWDIHSNCRYGLNCPKLAFRDKNCNRIARQIDPYLDAVAASGDDALLHQTLNRLAGDFPRVYEELEQKFLQTTRGWQ